MSAEVIEIVLLGAPRAKGRPRMAAGGTHAYTDAKTRSYEAALRYAAIEVMGDRPPLEGPLELEMTVKVPIPKSWPKKRQADALSGRIRPTSKPDWDNFGKVIDSANLVVWVDDGQIVDGRVRKFYSDKPGMFIRVWPLTTTNEGAFG